MLSINVLDIPSESTALIGFLAKMLKFHNDGVKTLMMQPSGSNYTTIVIKASGNTSAQIPPTSIENIDNLRVYPDQPQIDQEISAEGLLAKRTEFRNRAKCSWKFVNP